MRFAGRALCAGSLIALFLAACGGKGSTNRSSASGGAGRSAQAGASAHAGDDSGLGGSAGALPAGAGGGGATSEASSGAALPCVDDPLHRMPPCQVVGERPVPGPRPVCPLAEPQVGEACTVSELACGYGDAVTPACRKYYACSDGAWRLDPRIDPERYPCQEPPAGFCPSEPPPHNTRCSPESGRAPCVYADVLCACVSANHWATGVDEWLCYGPPGDPLCPRTLPNIGEGCATQGVQCSYLEDCEFPPYSTVFCREGAWEEGERSTPCSL